MIFAGDKPHRCNYCDYSAKHRATLYRHKLAKHRSMMEITLSQKQSRDFYKGSAAQLPNEDSVSMYEEDMGGLHILADHVEVVDYQGSDEGAGNSLQTVDEKCHMAACKEDQVAPPTVSTANSSVVINAVDVTIDEATLQHIMQLTPEGGTVIIQSNSSNSWCSGMRNSEGGKLTKLNDIL